MRDSGHAIQVRLADQVVNPELQPEAARLWPTPQALDIKMGDRGELVDKDGNPWNGKGTPYRKSTGSQVQVSLPHAVKIHEGLVAPDGSPDLWATPNTMDHLPQRSPEALKELIHKSRRNRARPANLREQVNPDTSENWKRFTEEAAAEGDPLWPTPRNSLAMAKDGKTIKKGIDNNAYKGRLEEAVMLHPTPAASHWDQSSVGGFRSHKSDPNRKKTGSLMESLSKPMLPTPTGKITRSGELTNSDGSPWDGVSKPHSAKTGKPIQTTLPDKAAHELREDAIAEAIELARENIEVAREKIAELKKQGGLETSIEAEEDYIRQMEAKIKQMDTTAIALDNLYLNPDWVDALMGYAVGWTDPNVDMAPGQTNAPPPDIETPRYWPPENPEIHMITEDADRPAKTLRRQRTQALGNAIVPQIAQAIGEMIRLTDEVCGVMED